VLPHRRHRDLALPSFRKPRRRIEAKGLDHSVGPSGELAKAEGGVTCCSVLVTIRE
jgi:hypothetical protein